ncbi:hypothetical protein VTK73DRAFT_10267 [Phialemonium thermophilum]|uniref:EGF-like domain-containing protein n=1 Tax=Phialemonium thermophilum TaxID=223376 RepID=A0ABR3XHK0_9PEZI
MSFPQNGRDMDRPSVAGGSVKKARERAQAGLRREDDLEPSQSSRAGDINPQMAQPTVSGRPVAGPAPGQTRIPRLQAPPGLQTKDGQIGLAISRPKPVPQWPLPGPVAAPEDVPEQEPSYRPPPGKSQPPQRPPRPSRVPSILDGSKVQDYTPVFQYRPRSGRDSSGQESAAIPETPSSVSRPSTLSSVGSIPDFPVPIPIAPPRRSVNLGPPPSARRGASSFYSNASYVSPIPEESPRSRSHTSFASSAAMPESWGSPSPGPSPNYPEILFEEAMAEEIGANPYDDDEEESRLVRSASIGKRGKPTLITTANSRNADLGESSQRPGPTPLQDPFKDGTGYVEASSESSGTIPRVKAPVPTAVTTDVAQSAAGAPAPSQTPLGRPFSRLSAIWRPPRLETEPTARAESRGSMTSLPDLIRRATRLAASLERGRRPASRFEDLDDSSEPDIFGRYGGDKELSVDGEKHQSGLSDMLAAFPPPAQANNRRSFRESLRQQVPSWPLPLNTNRGGRDNSPPEDAATSANSGSKKTRRYCGLPLWGFIVFVIVGLIVVAAAIVIPLEFFVIRKRAAPPPSAQPELQQCQSQLSCQNGGTNVVNRGLCSCICTNGFTGLTCTVAGATGCATTSVAGDANVNNVTLGDAIPRLIQQAESNFSVPLSPTTILAKLNAGNLSCAAENALVTFDGQATRQGDTSDEAIDPAALDSAFAVNAVDGMEYDIVVVSGSGETTVTVLPEAPTVTTTRPLGDSPSVSPIYRNGAIVGFSTIVPAPTTFSTIFATTISFPARPKSTATRTTTITTTITPPPSAPTSFAVTQETLDFARVAVLFILQEETLDNAETAQTTLQKFFTAASASRMIGGGDAAGEQARNISLGNGNSVNLVDFVVDTGTGVTAGKGVANQRL